VGNTGGYVTGGSGGKVGGYVWGRVTGGYVGGHPLWCMRQHHDFLASPHELSAPIAQLNGSPLGGVVVGNVGGAVGGGVGGGVGGIVGGKVGKGVGGEVGLEVGKTVLGGAVGQPRAKLLQQNSDLLWDHSTSKFAKPSSQSKGREVEDNPDNSQHKSGIRNNKLNKQHVVIKQVKSRRGRTTSKSPPHPTYLKVVSWMYSPAPVPT